MMMGMGQTLAISTAGAFSETPVAGSTTVVAPGYLTGLEAWMSPTTALSMLGTTLANFTTSFSGANLAPALGLWTPPLAIVAVLIGMGSKKGRR